MMRTQRSGVKAVYESEADRLEADALRQSFMSRHPELSFDEQLRTAHDMLYGALRYFLLKFTRTSVIAFGL